MVLDGLNDAQRAAVTSAAAPLCILAGAGSGKTRVLTRRIAYRCQERDADPRHVLALTFTRKAAGELGQRLRALGLRDRVAAGTFHAMAYAQLKSHWADQGVRPPALLDRKVRLLARLLPRGQNRPGLAADAASEIEWAKARVVAPNAYVEAASRAGRRPPLPPEAMGALYKRYEEEKSKRRLVDFDDLLWLCARELARNPDFAAAQRFRFRHLFVDEFQDVNPLQYRLLSGWLGERADLCVVGDANQAIYAWNGADAGYLTQFTRYFPDAGVVSLDLNYRSTPQVLAIANVVLEGGSGAGPRLRPTRPDGPLPSVHSYATDRHEARAVARAVRDRHAPGAAWSQQAVLARTHAQGVLLEEAFRAVDIPFRVRGRAPFLELPEIREALAALEKGSSLTRGLAVLEDSLPVDPEAGGDGEAGDEEPAEAPLGEALSDAEQARRRNLEALISLGEEYLRTDPGGTGTGFAAWLVATVRSEEPDAGDDAVDIATFHAAKGLEWPIVHIVGVEDGLVPIGHAKTPEAEAEERRLLYVGITRAERELRLSWAEERTFGTRTLSRVRSPYLVSIERALAALDAGADPVEWRAQLERDRKRLDASRSRRAPAAGGLTPADQEVFDALKRWRSEAARAADVPAFVIFHDSTLREVARSRPTSRQALLEVSGIGPAKAGRFGDAVLAVVAEHSAPVS